VEEFGRDASCVPTEWPVPELQHARRGRVDGSWIQDMVNAITSVMEETM
jgi:hypothetical protein